MTVHTTAYAIVIETGERNYSAFVPDLPGCVAVGKTLGEVIQRMQEAITLHIESLREHKEPVPEPRTLTATVVVSQDPALSA